MLSRGRSLLAALAVLPALLPSAAGAPVGRDLPAPSPSLRADLTSSRPPSVGDVALASRPAATRGEVGLYLTADLAPPDTILDPAEEPVSAPLARVNPVMGVAAGLSAVLTAGVYAARTFPAPWPVGGAAFYSRLSPDELLENETRAELYDLLQDDPGLSMQEVADRTGHGWGTIVYHLERLEDNGYLLSQESGRARRFFPSGAVDADEAQPLALLREETPRRIVEALAEEPGMNGRDLADELDLAPSTVSKHVGRLQEAGLVEDEPDGGEKAYFVDGLPVEGAGTLRGATSPAS